MKANRLSERTFADTSGEGRGNIGAIELPSYTVVIDSTMFPSTAIRFRKSLETQIKSPIRKLVLTHYHADHVFGNQAFEDCRIISSLKLLKRMQEEARTFELKDSEIEERPELAELKDLEMTFPTITFENAFDLKDNDSSIEITRVGGHTADSSIVYFAENRILFSGDLIFAKEFPWGGDKTCNPTEWIATLKLFKKLKIEKIVPGHGQVCDMEEVDVYLSFLEDTTAIIKELIGSGFAQKEVAEYDGFPSFYAYTNPERRRATLVRWYNFYKQVLRE
jgi:cyclase